MGKRGKINQSKQERERGRGRERERRVYRLIKKFQGRISLLIPHIRRRRHRTHCGVLCRKRSLLSLTHSLCLCWKFPKSAQNQFLFFFLFSFSANLLLFLHEAAGWLCLCVCVCFHNLTLDALFYGQTHTHTHNSYSSLFLVPKKILRFRFAFNFLSRRNSTTMRKLEDTQHTHTHSFVI